MSIIPVDAKYDTLLSGCTLFRDFNMAEPLLDRVIKACLVDYNKTYFAFGPFVLYGQPW